MLALHVAYSAAGATVIVQPPYEVAQRAWERAYVLRQEFDDWLSIEQRIRAEVVIQSKPEHLSWSEISDMVCIYASVAGVRV